MIINVDFEDSVDIATACMEANLYKKALNKIRFAVNIEVRFVFNDIKVTTATGDSSAMADAYCKEAQREQNK